MQPLIGSFYYKKTHNNNLIGEFTNNHTTEIITECSNATKPLHSFEGVYNCTWNDGTTQSAILTITCVGASKYALKWETPKSHKLLYTGEGFLIDENTLIGHYQGV